MVRSTSADQRVDLALRGLAVEVDAIGFQRVALLRRLLLRGPLGLLLVGAAHRFRLGPPGDLGDAVRDVVDRIEARHVLLLQEEHRMALALGEQGHQHAGAGHLVASRGLHMDHRALHDALETRGRLGFLAALGNQRLEFRVDIGGEIAPQLFHFDAAGAQDGDRVLVLGQRQQQVLQRGVFVLALIGQPERAMQRLL
jgi:hypothetical protein